MWFLIKGSVFFAAVLVVLSYFSSKPVTEIDGVKTLQVGDAMTAATQAYQYVSAICSEKPDVCQKGAETFSALGVRATEGARVAFELLDKQFGAKEMSVAERADPDPTSFPSKAMASAASTGSASSDQVYTGTVPLPQKRPTTR
ncbi:hypothetical protein EPK99_20550 [Neorhizobium lilium]|uniref:DUF5330 domain-containing protein n=1 Tax=Neorhizobium lilium TaxID=2503024 RepID=A0A444LE84_9HYPH|nr:DUF5330 domain-containing protein [Neorhizobium lilium]RWX76163.1 hypothetical protein EPK99_20550 [Neorhizobium lilium]